MVLDYGFAWIVEIIMKYFFADNHPKALITRGLERREARREIERVELARIESEKEAKKDV